MGKIFFYHVLTSYYISISHIYFLKLFWNMDSCSCGLWLINYMEYWTGTALSDQISQVIV